MLDVLSRAPLFGIQGLSLLGPLVLSLFCGACIGAERSLSGRAAGLRTYALVCLGSAIIMGLFCLPGAFNHVTGGQQGVDPGRVVQGLCSGIGFLGAGVIVRDGFSVKGLTTASAIWVTAAIGVLCGARYYGIALGATTFTLVMLSAARHVEDWLPARRIARVRVVCAPDALNESNLLDLLHRCGWKVSETFYRKNGPSDELEYTFVVSTFKPNAESALTHALMAESAVQRFAVEPSKD